LSLQRALALVLALSVSAAAACSRRTGAAKRTPPIAGDAIWFADGVGEGDAAIGDALAQFRFAAAKPVEGLEKTLTVDLQTGGLAPLKLTVTARFGTPGAYNGYALPTGTGTYTFTIKGKIESQDVNEKFESGPGRFGDIESTTALQYPNKVPAADDLNKRLGDMQSGIDQTRLLAAVAVVIGIVALGAAFAMSRRRT